MQSFLTPKPPTRTMQKPSQFLLSRETNMTRYDTRKNDGRFSYSHRGHGEDREHLVEVSARPHLRTADALHQSGFFRSRSRFARQSVGDASTFPSGAASSRLGGEDARTFGDHDSAPG